MSWCSTLHAVSFQSSYSDVFLMNIRVAEDDATNAAETVDTDLYAVSIAAIVYFPCF